MKQCYYRFTAAAAVLLALALALCGCSSGGNQAAAEETDAGGSGGSNFWNSEENGASAGTPANLNVTVDYSDFDGLDTWDDDACSIELHGGSASISGSGAEAEQREYYVVKNYGGRYVCNQRFAGKRPDLCGSRGKSGSSCFKRSEAFLQSERADLYK